MSNLKVVYFTVVFVSVTWMSSGLDCTTDELSNCVQNLVYIKRDIEGAAIVVMSDETVAANCRIYNGTKVCMREILDGCPVTETFKVLWQAVEDEYEWLCVLAPQDYLENNECFQNKELISDTQKCLDNFNRALGSYRADGSTCNIPNTYLDCVYGHVLRECGVNAAKWQKEYDIRAFGYILKNYGCVRNGDKFASDSPTNNEEECTEWNFQQCVVPFSDLDIAGGEEVLLVVMTDEQVDENCKIFERGKPCMEKLIDDCREQVQILWRTIDYGFSYLCEASKRQVYLRHNECFDITKLHADTMICYRTYQAAMTSTIVTTSQCQAEKEYINCTTNYILQYCGLEAAEWHRGYDIEVSKPSMEVIQCDLGGYVTPSPPSPSPSPSLTTSSPGVRQEPQSLQGGNSWHINIIAVIAIAVASIVVVLAVVILIVFIRRKSSPAPPGPPTAAVPPPYSVAYSGHTNESYSVDISGYGSNVYSNAPAPPLETKEPPPLMGETTTS